MKETNKTKQKKTEKENPDFICNDLIVRFIHSVAQRLFSHKLISEMQRQEEL